MTDVLWREALERFAAIHQRGLEAEEIEPTSVVLATASPQGRPSARVVLLKGFDAAGFVFYTNYESRKSEELLANPFGALCFYWKTLGEQVRVEGRVEQVTPAESDAYWASRARESQIGGWASIQSRPVGHDGELEERFVRFASEFDGGDVPRPPHWGGFRLSPDRVEFWTVQAHRLHERVAYTLTDGAWQVGRLFP